MNGKEALKRLYYDAISSIIDEEIETINREEIEKDYMNVKQDLDRLEKLEKDIKEYRKAIKSWNENGGNLLKENTKLKEALKFLCEELEIKLCSNGYLSFEDKEYYLDYQSDIDLRTLHRITKEKYNLLEEVLSNER